MIFLGPLFPKEQEEEILKNPEAAFQMPPTSFSGS